VNFGADRLAASRGLIRWKLLSAITIVLFLVSSVYSLQAAEPGRTAGTFPNVVLLIGDDQGWGDYGFMGHPEVRTPSLDALAKRSAVFRRGYVPTALCRPSLMTMITGRYPHQHGVTGNDPWRSSDCTEDAFAELRAQLIAHASESRMLPESLQEKGYLSFQSGKWWEGNFRPGGFTEGMTRGFPQPGGRHGDDGLRIGREGVRPVLDFIDASAEAKKPFFVWYAPMLPHTPHNPPDRILKHYQDRGCSPASSRYYAMCEWFDETCGRILQHLEKAGLTDDTIVISVCDNGWIQPDPEKAPLPDGWKQPFAPRSKQSPYEGGIRTPILVSWPRYVKATVREDPISSLDLVPTILAAAGVSVDDRSSDADSFPGINLLPDLSSGTVPSERFLCGESFTHDVFDLSNPERSLMYRWGIMNQWKLILTYPCEPDRYANAHRVYDSEPQLYDLAADPMEQQNLASMNPDVVRQIEKQMQGVWHVTKRPTGVP
jgi:arylsulfatase A-like enzyme